MLNNFKELKMNVILDLDNTIICAVEMSYYKKYQSQMKILDETLLYRDMDNSYRIYFRPNLGEFLKFVFRNFKVSIFTAASKDYALFIFDNIIKYFVPEARLEYFFFYYHTELSEAYYNSPKNLKLLWEILPTGFNKNNTIIIDDLDDVKTANGFNCINIKAFETVNEDNDTIVKNVKYDNELIHVMDVLKLAIY